MNLMKQMYEEGDDEMKRTIAKAWTEARDKKSPDEVLWLLWCMIPTLCICIYVCSVRILVKVEIFKL